MDTTALKLFIANVLRHGVSAIGTLMIAHGFVDKNASDALLGSPLWDQLAGVIVTSLGVALSHIESLNWQAEFKKLQDIYDHILNSHDLTPKPQQKDNNEKPA